VGLNVEVRLDALGLHPGRISDLDFDFWAWAMEKYDRAVEEFDGPAFEQLLADVQRGRLGSDHRRAERAPTRAPPGSRSSTRGTDASSRRPAAHLPAGHQTRSQASTTKKKITAAITAVVDEIAARRMP